jgi:predicted enzyme related to lactoylglutathione lyase
MVRFEIETDQPERSLAFYSRVFGWQAERLGEGADHWLMIDESESPADVGGRASRLKSAAAARGALCIVEVSSLDNIVARVQRHGGRVQIERVDTAGVGLVALCHDLDGNLFGLVQRAGFDTEHARTRDT